MAKLMMNGTQVGGTNGSASSVTCENGKTVEERLNSLDTNVGSKIDKSGGVMTGNLLINNGNNDTPNIIFISPSYGEFDIDYCNEEFRIYKVKNGTITFPFTIRPDGNIYSSKGKIVDAYCFSYSNGTLNINI